MELKFRDIVLRDFRESDVEDEIRWNTVETQWALWDAPWETEEELAAFDPEAHRIKCLEDLAKPQEAFRCSLELDANGVHIGAVSAYLVDENYEWTRGKAVLPGQTVYHTLGLDICEAAYWGKGFGKQALTAWIFYHLDQGVSEFCLQTWSGNTRMIRAAERLGFAVCCRKQGFRRVRGGVYDGLTFRLDFSRFRRFLLEENLRDLALPLETKEAVLSAYDRRPDWYEAAAQSAYGGTVPDFPICALRPLERLVTWCCHLTQVRRNQRHGIPEAILKTTWRDITLRTALYMEKTGRPGLSKEDVIWLRHLDSGSLFCLGSLQFQLFHMVYLDREGCGEDYMTFSPDQKRRLPPGTPVLNVHIPKGADLTPAAVDASFRQAETFFAQYVPEHKARAFLCCSWLLYPGLQTLLPPESHILQFAARFRVIGQAKDPTEAIRRIYGRRYRRKQDYPQNTSLQRNALGRFSSLGEGFGILEMPPFLGIDKSAAI